MTTDCSPQNISGAAELSRQPAGTSDEPSEWRPIATAKRGGKSIILHWPNSYELAIASIDEDGIAYLNTGTAIHVRRLHADGVLWQPCPELPARAVARGNQPEPVQRWELPAAPERERAERNEDDDIAF